MMGGKRELAFDRLREENANLHRQLKAVDAALDAAKFPRRHQGTNDYPHLLDRIGRITEVAQYLQNERDYWQETYDRCGRLEAENEQLRQRIKELEESWEQLFEKCGAG
jgi:septation ring formation regulator EzrA